MGRVGTLAVRLEQGHFCPWGFVRARWGTDRWGEWGHSRSVWSGDISVPGFCCGRGGDGPVGRVGTLAVRLEQGHFCPWVLLTRLEDGPVGRTGFAVRVGAGRDRNVPAPLVGLFVEVDFDEVHLLVFVVAFFHHSLGVGDYFGFEADLDSGIELHDGFHELLGFGDILL